MEIEFQNDYTTPTFVMDRRIGYNLSGGPYCALGQCTYLANIYGVPYPNDLDVSVSFVGGYLRFINTSTVTKILTIGFDIIMPIYSRFCPNNLTDTTEIAESSPLGNPFPQVNDADNISITMAPNIPYSIFSSNQILVNGEITFFDYVDYIVKPCTYATPTFTMQERGNPAQVNCNGPNANCYVENPVFITNILYIPYPKDLKDTYAGGILSFTNTSTNVKVLTIGFDIDIPVYAQSCNDWGLTATVRLLYNGDNILMESGSFNLARAYVFPGIQTYDCKKISFNNTENYTNIIMEPNVQYYIYAKIYVKQLGTSCIPGAQMALNYYNNCNPGAFSGKITFFNYVNA